MTTGQFVLLGSVLLAAAVGTVRLLADGRFAGTRRIRGTGIDPADAGATGGVLAGHPRAGELGERATLVQFSSAFCAPCRTTRQVLSDVAGTVPGVAHVELDAESHLDLVRRLGVLRTPTTLVLDEAGHEVSRASGAPRREQVLAALGVAVG